MVIAVDAGHGRHTSGKRFPLELTPDVKAPNFVPEWEPNQQVATRLCRLLEQYKGVKVVRMDDPSGETDVPLHSRPRKANEIGADVYVSIHHNAAGGISNASGIVVFAYNKDTRNTPVSIKLMETAYRNLIRETGMKGNRYDGTVRKNLCVLRESAMPAILCELGFMTNPQESKIIRTPAHFDKCARALCKTLVEVFHLQPKKPAPKPAPKPKPRPTVPEENKEDDDMITQERFNSMMEVYLASRGKHPAAGWAEDAMLAAKTWHITDGNRPGAFAERQEVSTQIVKAINICDQHIEDAINKLLEQMKKILGSSDVDNVVKNGENPVPADQPRNGEAPGNKESEENDP